MKALHLIAAVLACWRATEIITHESLFEPIRLKWPNFMAKWCALCMSVWMAMAAVVIYFYYPVLNWPFAVSWIYMQGAAVFALLQTHLQRRIVITVTASGRVNVERFGLSDEDTSDILMNLTADAWTKRLATQPQTQSRKENTHRPVVGNHR